MCAISVYFKVAVQNESGARAAEGGDRRNGNTIVNRPYSIVNKGKSGSYFFTSGLV
jgi:hypothetical protein